MNHWSNRFASAGLLAMVCGCSLMPHHGAPADVEAPPAGVPASPPAHSGSAAVGSSSTAPEPAAQPQALRAPPKAAALPPTGIAAATAPVPDAATQRYQDALRLMKSARYKEAQAALESLTKDYPALSGPPLNLGLAYEQEDRLADAESAMQTSLGRDASNAVAANALAIVQRKRGKFADAESNYLHAIEARPDYAPTYLNLGVLYDLYLAEPQKALDQYEHYLQLAGENKQVGGWVVELRKRLGVKSPPPKKEPA